MTAGLGGPVSASLEAELRSLVRQRGIVVWLDQAGHYTEFVDRLQALAAGDAWPYAVHAFRGSYLALMMELDGVAAGTQKTPLVVHLPGLAAEAVRKSPMLELYHAGRQFRRALDTLVTDAAAGRVRPDLIDAFRAQRGLTLEGADAWLAAQLGDTTGGLATNVPMLTPAVFDDLLGAGQLAHQLAADDPGTWDRLAAWLGVPGPWRDATLVSGRPSAADFAFAAASWALAVEYVHDLARAPRSPLLAPASDLPRAVVDNCRAVAAHLREQHRDFYRRTADETEALIVDEVEAAQASDLGKVDTFRFEEDKVLKAALAALDSADYDRAAGWADLRLDPGAASPSFWLRDDPNRTPAWQLVRRGAQLGQAILAAGGHLSAGTSSSLEAAVDVYVERGAAVDQAHRHLEQARTAMLYPQLPEFETLRARLDDLRGVWRSWADGWAREFNDLCRTDGFLPASALQQRTLFNDVVRPMTQEDGVTALFMVDALRFEMAEELYRELAGTPATAVALKARLAELPTVTEVGMNVLAPVERSGRLQVAMAGDTGGVLGFQTGEFRVLDPDTRRRAMHERVGGTTCPLLTLDEVVSRDSASLKRTVAQARLVVVHSQEIDNAGEKGVGPSAFAHALRKLRGAWSLLRDAGVRRFVITSDHGFLLLDDAAATAQSHGRRIDPHRRHVFSTVAADHPEEARVALADLRYEGLTGHVMFPASTAVFDTGRRSMSFAHGGNSLQERVIPVLTIIHRTASGGSTVRYGITAEPRGGVAGMHCVKATVQVLEERALDFGNPQEIELALRVKGVDGVQVELGQVRDGARIAGGVVVARVGETFEVFFRLAGSVDTRVPVEFYHPSGVADVEPGGPDARFAVTATGHPAAPAAASAVPAAADWLDHFSEPNVRQVFEHLAAHGTVTEEEAATMLGGPRGLRRFALHLEDHVRRAPFGVRIDVVAGVKRYVREGSG